MRVWELLAERLFGADLARVAPVLLLVLARTLPLAWAAPWLGWRGTATVARLAVAIALALALTPLALSAAPAGLPSGWLPLSLMATREVLMGLAFAVAVSVPLYALGWTGSLIDRWRGSVPDSTEATTPGGSPLGTLHVAAGVVLFLLLGGHRLALAAFADSVVDAPVGSGADAASLAAFAWGVARLVTEALSLTVAFAAPAVVSFVVLEIVLGLWGRAAPALRLWMEGMSLRAALGVAVALLGLTALLPRLGPLFASSIEAASELMRR